MEYIPAPEVADKRVKNGSQTISAEEVISLYGTYIYNIALKLSGKPEMAEDIAQEAYRSTERSKCNQEMAAYNLC